MSALSKSIAEKSRGGTSGPKGNGESPAHPQSTMEQKRKKTECQQSSSTPQKSRAPARVPNTPRVLIIGAGSRGQTYAHCMTSAGTGMVVAVAELDDFKRASFGRRYIWGGAESDPPDGSCFSDWRHFITYEKARRRRQEAAAPRCPLAVDAAFVCVQDDQHRACVEALAPLGMHIMCEKPLATTLDDCIAVFRALRRGSDGGGRRAVFGLGHVLRYSPHNVMLRDLLVRERVIGDVLSVVHTEPVGYWHFAHSYVRGNWRRADTSAPSLLTKSCHDMDILLWLLCSPPSLDSHRDAATPPLAELRPHLPATVSSTGALQYYRQSRKPLAAGAATNCLSCPIERQCKFSARRIYADEFGLAAGNTGWPVKIVLPEIEEYGAGDEGRAALLAKLAEDYPAGTPDEEIKKRNWFGRCVYECDNDVCDDQVVTITWDEDPLPPPPPPPPPPSSSSSSSSSSSPAPHTASSTDGEKNCSGGGGGGGGDSSSDNKQQTTTTQAPVHRPVAGGRGAKQATFHMVSHTEKICDRYSHFYGTDGELEADSHVITVTSFASGQVKRYRPAPSRGHGGGDGGLTNRFLDAVARVKNLGHDPDAVQRDVLGCTPDDILMSHALVFAAEEARSRRKVIEWDAWWKKMVQEKL